MESYWKKQDFLRPKSIKTFCLLIGWYYIFWEMIQNRCMDEWKRVCIETSSKLLQRSILGINESTKSGQMQKYHDAIGMGWAGTVEQYCPRVVWFNVPVNCDAYLNRALIETARYTASEKSFKSESVTGRGETDTSLLFVCISSQKYLGILCPHEQSSPHLSPLDFLSCISFGFYETTSAPHTPK